MAMMSSRLAMEDEGGLLAFDLYISWAPVQPQ